MTHSTSTPEAIEAAARATAIGMPYVKDAEAALTAAAPHIAEAKVQKLLGAISWLEPPFVDDKTPEAELRSRIKFMLRDSAAIRSLAAR